MTAVGRAARLWPLLLPVAALASCTEIDEGAGRPDSFELNAMSDAEKRALCVDPDTIRFSFARADYSVAAANVEQLVPYHGSDLIDYKAPGQEGTRHWTTCQIDGTEPVTLSWLTLRADSEEPIVTKAARLYSFAVDDKLLTNYWRSGRKVDPELYGDPDLRDGIAGLTSDLEKAAYVGKSPIALHDLDLHVYAAGFAPITAECSDSTMPAGAVGAGLDRFCTLIWRAGGVHGSRTIELRAEMRIRPDDQSRLAAHAAELIPRLLAQARLEREELGP